MGVMERNGKLYECVCSMLRRVSAAMPPYIRRAEVLQEHLETQLMSAHNKSLFVVASWADMKPIIKAVMIKNPNMSVKITSDREIRDVFVGSTSRAARGDGEIVYNNLEDLMNPPHLCIVRLNEMSYKNKAAPGALEEALSFRLDRDKPMWVLSNVSKPFGIDSFAYSESVWDLISSMDMLRLPVIHQTDRVPIASVSSAFGAPEMPQVRPSEPSERKSGKGRRKASEPESGSDTGLGSIYGGGLGSSKKIGRRD